MRWKSLFVTAVAFAPGVLSCGGPPPPEPPAPADGGPEQVYCPAPQVFEPGETRPVRVRIENRTDRTLDVFIDRCWHHTWLAEVAPGRYRQPELPDGLITFPEGLRFQVFDMAEGRRFGIYGVPLEEKPVLTLVLDEEGRADPDSLTLYTFEGQKADRTVGSFAVLPDEERGFAMLQADPGLAILTWSCVDGEGALGIGLPGKLEGDEVDVLMRRDDGDFEPVGPWPVQRGFNDALAPPGDDYDELRRWFGGEAAVDLLVDDGGSRQVHRFRVARLEDALAELGCWGPAPPSGGATGPAD